MTSIPKVPLPEGEGGATASGLARRVRAQVMQILKPSPCPLPEGEGRSYYRLARKVKRVQRKNWFGTAGMPYAHRKHGISPKGDVMKDEFTISRRRLLVSLPALAMAPRALLQARKPQIQARGINHVTL